MQVGDLYHSAEHGLVIVRQAALTHQSMNGKSLYKVVIQVLAEGNLYRVHMTRDHFDVCFTRL